MRIRPHRWLTPLVLALLTAFSATAALAAGNGKLQIHHMKIGQGDGTLLISPNGQTALFDDGVYTNCTYIKSYLQGLGIASVDYHFLSHYHADHLGCIDDLAAIGITVLTAGYDRGNSYSSATYTAYTTTLGAKRTTIAKGQTITLDAGSANPVTVTCVDLNGAGVYSVSGSDENAKSAVYKVSYGAFDEIVGGDLTGSTANGNDVETTIGPEVGDVEVYKVHHHGSAYSSNDNWLNAITPEVGIIMCGDGNTYGHPTAAALTRLHNHSVKTYWTETGAGATPDAAWDKVANGTVLVEVNLASNNYTVTAGASTDTYTIPTGGPPPTLNDSKVASAVTMTQGTITAGSVASLAASDNTKMTVTSAKTGTNYWTDWYGEAVLAHPPTSLTVTFEASYSVSRTQTLHVWNWSTSAWEQVNSATVSTTDAVKTWTTNTPANYVSPAGVVRFRALANTRTSSYTCRADQLKFDYTYLQGTITTRTPEEYARLVPPTYHEPYRNLTPQASVRTLTASAIGRKVALAWSTGAHDHMDGFNIYRENASGERVHVGGEAVMATTAEEITFGWTDENAPEGESVYWLGARSCAGPEGMIGPIRVTRAAAGPALETFAFAAAPNPAVRNVRFALTLPSAGAAELAIFDLSGRRVATPLKGALDAGTTHVDWALQRDDGGRVQPGVYFARIEVLGRTQVARVTVLQP
ncbi:MAG: T9SS type A sorting domain-containing protein [Candidatus Eisenbacteria bacterium]|uniref:T9SS type A sorting domain-containing protein n=1 Tax=Eiseniibacteriota bacterium TaxID=2212470 RepID=A0A933SCL2_UNCEI|nr:T9SS type A sorting domain-containing protein [Candidatus Eisenbacteria bacterium]